MAAFTQQSLQLVNSLAYKSLASLTLSPKRDGRYLIFAKGQLEPKSENEYVTVYCQVKSQRTDIVPVGSEAQLDHVEMRLYYGGVARGVTVPQSKVLNGVQQVTAGSTWTVNLSCLTDVGAATVAGVKLYAIQSSTASPNQ